MVPSPASQPSGPKIYKCGSLTYTAPQLAILLFWLLWGDFCYVLMEGVIPSIMPLKLKALEASNTTIGLVLASIPMAINTVLNPVISFRSDRYRSRWGRRIPFILFSIPFLVICLAGLGFGPQIGGWLHQFGGSYFEHLSPNMAILLVICAIMIVFSIFNSFVNSAFWYLFNDVVPEYLLARFMSWFRLVSLGSVSLYNLFIFPHAETHYTEILVGAALLYLVGFSLMCFNVREGTYPPPSPNLDGKTGLISAIKTFARECHSHPHYWYMFMGTVFSSCAGSMGIFMLLFYKGTGLDTTQTGQILFAISISTAVLILGSGWLADRYHPIRVVMAGQALQLAVVFPAMCLWIFWHPAGAQAFWVWLVIAVGLMAPAAALIGVSDPPLLMRIFPRERYGQFCAANAMWRSIGGIAGGVLAGIFLDTITQFMKPDNVYAYIPVWQIIFNIPVVYCIFKMYQTWKQHGGDAAYVAPLPKSVLVPEPVAIVGMEGVMRNSEEIAESADPRRKDSGQK